MQRRGNKDKKKKVRGNKRKGEEIRLGDERRKGK